MCIFLFRHHQLAVGFCFAAVLLAAQSGARADGVVLTNFVRLTNGSVQLTASGATGQVCSLQVSGNLNNWRTLDFTNIASGDAVFLDSASALFTSHYYRARLDTPVTNITVTSYHGWANSIVMRNSQVEVVIVPAVGRIMQFRFLDQADGPFWENSSMYGQQPSATSWNNPGSFGGDKAWPSPQSVWNWPPPSGFDLTNYTATVSNGVVTLTGPVAPAFGTRVVRRITLHPTEPILRVSTTFEKMSGVNNQMGVWVITQTKDAQRIFMPVPANSVYTSGYTSIPGNPLPPVLTVTNNSVSFVRNPNTSSKIGNDAGALLWVGTNNMLLIESPRLPGLAKTNYPDGWCSAEVYVNAGSTAYIELELLAPMVNLGAGNTAEATSVYSLFRRTQPTPFDEAIKIFSP
ncbi:MAG: hypothetical protein PHY43_07120 [Verrucomicrobiales bacterium]|nr:hypothetical protein [Verrucomicrobiales bacterium]